jgi:hypothetical protein
MWWNAIRSATWNMSTIAFSHRHMFREDLRAPIPNAANQKRRRVNSVSPSPPFSTLSIHRKLDLSPIMLSRFGDTTPTASNNGFFGVTVERVA